MVRRGKKKLAYSRKPKQGIIGNGIGKKNGTGKKIGSVRVEALLSAAGSASDDEYAGYIFLCNGRTKPECFIYRIFGLPSMKIDIVAKIKPDTKLFLFDFDVKLLYGVYSATSTGNMNLEPLAFGGRFPAQVSFEIFKECMPMPESNFKHVIKDNYQGSKFRQNLSADQVDKLISLFRPLPPPPASESPSSLLSKETHLRKILQQEIEKQSCSQQAPGSQYIASRFAHALYKDQPLSLPLYDSVRPVLSTDWAHERSFPSQLYPLNKLVPYDNLYHTKLPQHSYLTEYSASNPGLHGLPSGYMNGPLLSREDVNHRMGLSNDYYIHQNQSIGQGYIPQKIPRQISVSAPLPESDRAPSSVLAAAYWAAVANEIPKPSVVDQASGPGSGHIKTEHDSGTSVQYKPPNLTSQSILDAYWEAKNLEDSRQAQPGSSHMLPHSSQQPISTTQESVFLASRPSHAYYDDQSHLQHPNQLTVLISSQGGTASVFPTSHTETGNVNGNQVATFTSGFQQQVVYDPSGFQMQHGLQQQVVYDPAGIQIQQGIVPQYYPT